MFGALLGGLLGSPVRKLIALLVVVGLCVGGVLAYGKSQYREGVRDTTARFVEKDKEGADDVRKIGEEILNDIGDDPDVDELLRNSGGWRNDDGDISSVE